MAHEIVHAISANQSLAQKEKLTGQFLGKCNISGRIKKGQILEEPMAVGFGQLIYDSKFRPKKFTLASNLYSNKWVSSFARQIYVSLRDRFVKGETINDGFIDDAAIICNEALLAAELLNK